MPIYLRTQDVLNVAVSCTRNYFTHDDPKPVNLLTWLHSGKHRSKIDALRSVEDKKKRDALKACIPAITPSGLFTYIEAKSLTKHSGLIQFDIDPTEENGQILNYANLKAQICNLPFVAYCGLSASGKGYWGLVPIAYPERHSQHFAALKRVFDHYRINLDEKPRSVASLRGYSYDAAPYVPERVMLFELYDIPQPAPPARRFERTADTDTERARAEVCIYEVSKRGIYIGANYADWYAVGCSLANGFGESGRDYYHHVSQHYPGYRHTDTDRQFTACSRANSRATLGTFYKLCADAGIEWKALMPYTPPNRPTTPAKLPRPLTSDSVTVYHADHPAPATRPRMVLNGRTAYGDVLEVEPADSYPAEWDTSNAPDATPTLKIQSWNEYNQTNKLIGNHL